MCAERRAKQVGIAKTRKVADSGREPIREQMAIRIANSSEVCYRVADTLA